MGSGCGEEEGKVRQGELTARCVVNCSEKKKLALPLSSEFKKGDASTGALHSITEHSVTINKTSNKIYMVVCPLLSPLLLTQVVISVVC
jgi:hypothetical protein